MKQFLPQFRGAQQHVITRVFVLPVLLFFTNLLFAQSSGIFESYAILSINGGANSFYDMQATTVLPDFQGASLGTFTPGLGSLVFKGGQNKTFKNGGCNINASHINYRVYKTGNTPGSFIQIDEPFDTNIGSSGDQQWTGTSGTTNLLTGLTPGNYTLETYSDANYDSCGTGTHFSSNGGANYKATFVVANVIVTSTAGTGAPSASYATLAAAVTAINGGTVHTGTITCYVTAGYTETAPVGGYSITATGTSANPIIFQKSGSGTNPTFTAPTPQTTGALNDAIFKIIGGDYITIDGFTMLENAANTTTAAATNNMTEFGIALFYASVTNGCQNVTIKNNTIDLDRTYQNTFGIYSNSTHTATAVSTAATATGATGGNNNLTVTVNTITDVNTGIVVVGPTAAADSNDGLIIGGSLANANTITNFGTTGTFSGFNAVSGTVNGIQIRNTKNFTISYNTITSSNGGTTSGTLRGIYINAASNAPTGTITDNITNNIISVRSAVASGAILGIHVDSPIGNATTTLNINSNDFNTSGPTVTGSGTFTAIQQASTVNALTINSNTFTNLSVNTTGTMYLINNNCGTNTFTINGNAISGTCAKTGAGGIFYGYYNFGSPTGGTATISNNNFSNITVTGATQFWGIRQYTATSQIETITTNTISNITGGSSSVIGVAIGYGATGSSANGNIINAMSGSSTVTGINVGDTTAGAGITDCNNNMINGLTSSGASTAIGILGSLGTTNNFTANKIYDIQVSTATGTAAYGISISGGTTTNIVNNLVGDIKAPAVSLANPVVGITVSGGTTANVYYNTIYLNAASTGTNFGSSAFSVGSTVNLTLRNNIFVNNSTPNGTGRSVAYRRSSTTLTTYQAASNNNLFYAGTPGASRIIYTDGTNEDQTLAAYKTRVAARDSSSITENPPFLSTTGSSANFLHIDPAVATGIESAGTAIAGITTDYDGNTRNATTPDIGADEGTFTALPPPVITSLATTNGCAGTSLVINGTGLQAVNAVTIGGTAATVTATTATTVTVTVGAGTTGTVNVVSPQGNSTSSQTFTVNPLPTATWAPTAIGVCGSTSAQTTTLAYSATTNAPITYSITWNASPTNSFATVTNASFSGAPGGGTINITVPSNTNAGTYTGSITVQNANGCSSSASSFTLTVQSAPPTTTGVNICPGGAGSLTSSTPCADYLNSGTTISGAWNAVTDPIALRPTTSINNSATCSFDAAVTRNYQAVNFKVSATGSYTLEMNNSASFDGMAYIVTGAFTPGNCTAGGTWIKGDDDGGTAGDEPLMTATLTAGTIYTLISTTYGATSGTYTGSYAYTVTPPAGAQIQLNGTVPVSWYTVATNGSPIGSGTPFNPVGVTGSGLPDTNTPGTYTFYAACSSNSTCRTATTFVINPPSIAGTVSADQTICSGSQPSDITLSGSAGSIQWQSSLNGTTFTNISGQTAPTLTGASIGTLTATMYYRAVVTNGTCAPATSAAVTVTVNPTSVAGTVSADQAICSGSQPADITLSGSTGSIQWQSSINGTTFTDISGQNAATLPGASIGALTATRYYRAIVTSGVCAAATSAVVTVTVSPASVAGTVSADQTICSGSQPADITLTGSTGTIQWQSSTDNFTFTDISGQTFNTLSGASIGALTMTMYYRAIVTSGVCGSATSAVVTVTVGGSTTWNGIAWSNGTPNGFMGIIFTGGYTSAGNLSGCSLYITNNATVTISAGDDFSINSSVTVDSGSNLVVSNTANLIQISNASNTGSITVQCDSNPLMRQDYTLWSSPVSGAQTLQNFSIGTLANRFYTYNPATDLYNAVVDPSTATFATGTGYLIRVPNTHPTVPTIWNGEFEGTPNNGNVNLSVTSGTYNGIGNPYPSAIDADAFITDNSLTEALYFWRKTNNSANTSYATYTLAGGAGTSANAGDPNALIPNGVIRAGQGFIAKATSATLAFTNSMRTADNSGVFFRSQITDRSRVWINLTNTDGAFSQTMVAYMTGATMEIDAAIDGKYFNDSELALTSLINNVEYAVQGRSLPFNQGDIVPLGFKVITAGTYTIALDHFDGMFVPASQGIFLRDNLTGLLHDLRSGAYTFAADAGTANTRFQIEYQLLLATTSQVWDSGQVIVYKDKGELVINSGNVTMDHVEIFDIRGRLITGSNNINASEVRITAGAVQEVLIVKITSDDNRTVTKKAVN